VITAAGMSGLVGALVGTELQSGANGCVPGPSKQTGQGGVATTGGAVGEGAAYDVDRASQCEGMVAGSGPFWMGLHPGRRSSAGCSNTVRQWTLTGVWT
jgi:hypothetical protein